MDLEKTQSKQHTAGVYMQSDGGLATIEGEGGINIQTQAQGWGGSFLKEKFETLTISFEFFNNLKIP